MDLVSGSLVVAAATGELSSAKVGAGGPADDELVDGEGNVKLKVLLVVVSCVGVNPGADSLEDTDFEGGVLKKPSKLGGGVGIVSSAENGLDGDGENEAAPEETNGPGSGTGAGGTLGVEGLR